MILAQALQTKDEVTKQRLISLFSDDKDTIDRIEEGFRQGDERWHDALIATVGRRLAQSVFSALNKELPTPK